MKVNIHFARFNEPVTIFTEGFVNENETRLKTFSVIPTEFQSKLTIKWHQKGMIHKSQKPYSVTKYYFFKEYFDILEFNQENGELLGYYCDIVTPLEKLGSEYYITDLFLDFWISPTGSFTEFDIDEFEVAFEKGLISKTLREKTQESFARIRNEIETGLFPNSYIDD
ncbi:MAG: DUF402 domain-containing protein [Chitinispirillia bacterium]|jgi:predicted RNA-binding protein associated with RNAse of E/G family